MGHVSISIAVLKIVEIVLQTVVLEYLVAMEHARTLLKNVEIARPPAIAD
jgi:hypothetical protein